MPSRERKVEYFERMFQLLEEYETILIVGIDHVSSGQVAKIRQDLRPLGATVLMGKNTLMRKVIDQFVGKHSNHAIEALSPYIVGNCGLIFVKKDLQKVRDLIKLNVEAAPAKIGQRAECDVIVPSGPTGCDPGQTSWFQALNVPTKIVKGQIEIISKLKLITKGEKVGASEAALLTKLRILPFTYCVKFFHIFMNGSVFDSAILDITEDDIRQKFLNGLQFLAKFSLGVGIPTTVSLPHTIGHTVRQMLAICATLDFKMRYSEPWDKLFSLSPEELAALSVPALPPPSPPFVCSLSAPETKSALSAEEWEFSCGCDFPGGSGAGRY